MATADMTVKSVGANQDIEGKELAQSLEKLVELKSYCERAARRLGGDAHLLDTLLEAFAGRRACCAKKERRCAKFFRTVI